MTYSDPEAFYRDAPKRMAGNRARDTLPERKVRSSLDTRGLRYSVDLPLRVGKKLVRPDIAFTRCRLAVYIDGCFWHCCPLHGNIPVRNRAYWLPKLEANVARDRTADTALQVAGWTVLRLWEHEDPQAAGEKIAARLALVRAELSYTTQLIRQTGLRRALAA